MPAKVIKPIETVAVFRPISKDTYRKKSLEIAAFKHPSTGDIHEVKEIRQVYTDRKGNHSNIHYVIETDRKYIFDVVLDTQKLCWFLVYEME